jgi:oligopeptide transport system substrate-binding protein
LISVRAALIGIALLASCIATGAAQTPPVLATEQALTVSLDNAPATLDPLLTTETATQHILDDLFEGLVTLGIDGRPVPGVARDWSVSADEKTWQFHLRGDARWSNGSPVTAQDFIYAWRREVDPRTGAAYAQSLAPLVNAQEIEAGKMPPSSLGVESPDPKTLVMHLTAPVPYLLDILNQQYFYPLYEPAISKWGDEWVRPEHMVSNGAFRLQDTAQNTRVILTKNPYYWDARNVRLERVTYLVLPDPSVHALRFQSGDVQFAYTFPASQSQWLNSHFPGQAITAPYLGTLLIEFNMQSKPFKNNLPLRRALSMAIDRDALTRYIKQGLNVSAVDLVPPLTGYTQADPAWAKLSDTQRYEEARRLYKQAGYSAEHPLRLELSIPAQGPDSRHVFEAVIAMWYEHLGAEVALDQRELKVLMQEERLHKVPLYQFAWTGDFPDPLTFLALFSTDSETNFGDYSSSSFDRLIGQAEQSAAPGERYQLLTQAEGILNDDAAMIPLFYYGSRHLIKPYVKGWQSNLIDRHPARFMYVLQH